MKEKDSAIGICIDYRKLNRKIIKNRHHLPIIEDQIDQLANARIFTIEFFHVPVTEGSIKYISFANPNGQYEFLRTPFGLCDAPAVFQRYTNKVFRDLMRKCIAMSYMDDIIF